jgi:hypothetical protein
MPSTPAAGWRQLPYFDPPTEPGGKPVLIASPPAAVFGSRAQDGRQHAHRIWVAPDGAGKADLQGRDCKKSAPGKAAGCIVQWGNLAAAPRLIVAEGVETGAAVALAHRPEIDAGEIAVVAAIASAGIASLEPWPATSSIIAAADRDEAKPPTDAGYRAGEKAARKLAKRLAGKVEVAIALPGTPGTSCDFLDVLRRDGPGAVRAGIAAAEVPQIEPDPVPEARDDGRPTIRLAGGTLASNVIEAEAALAVATRAEPTRGIYQRAGQLVRVVRLNAATEAGGIKRAEDALVITPASPDVVRLRLAESATWLRFAKREREWSVADPPPDVARILTNAAGCWPNTPHLVGIVEAPTLRPDRSVIERPGYDEISGLYFDPGATDFAPIPDKPTLRQAEAALAKLLEILRGFPFVDDPSRAVALAMIMTPLVRHAARAAPLFAISAPDQGSGKTLLGHLPAYVATGWNSGKRMRGTVSPGWGKSCCISPCLCCRRASSFRPSAAIKSSSEPRQSAIFCCSRGDGAGIGICIRSSFVTAMRSCRAPLLETRRRYPCQWDDLK